MRAEFDPGGAVCQVGFDPRIKRVTDAIAVEGLEERVVRDFIEGFRYVEENGSGCLASVKGLGH